MFRQKYLDYAELSQQLAAWSNEHPDIAHVISIGRSAEGRDIPLLIIGRNPDEARPAVWIDGNMHASEVCGSSVALAMAEDILAIHQGALEAGGKAFPAHMAEAIRETLFYVVPRISPDGAEQVLKRGRYVRSSPVNDRADKGHAYWESRRHRRRRHRGLHAARGPGRRARGAPRRQRASRLDPPVMGPRMPEDPGPYFKLYPEGRIVNFDGRNDSRAVLPLRQPVRLQPELSLRVGAGAAAGRRGALSGQRAGDARDPGVRDPPSEHLCLAQPAHVRRRAHPAARRQARHARWIRSISRSSSRWRRG